MNFISLGEIRFPKYEIAVVGGGMAGIAAVIASARNGVKTILIEKNGGLPISWVSTLDS